MSYPDIASNLQSLASPLTQSPLRQNPSTTNEALAIASVANCKWGTMHRFVRQLFQTVIVPQMDYAAVIRHRSKAQHTHCSPYAEHDPCSMCVSCDPEISTGSECLWPVTVRGDVVRDEQGNGAIPVALDKRFQWCKGGTSCVRWNYASEIRNRKIKQSRCDCESRSRLDCLFCRRGPCQVVPARSGHACGQRPSEGPLSRPPPPPALLPP